MKTTLLGMCGFALTAGTVFAGGGTITSGDASLQLIGPIVFSSNLADSNLRLDGATSPDQQAKFTWYYRQLNNNQNRYMSFLDTPTETYVGDTATATYPNAGSGVAGFERFDAQIVTKLIDGATPNVGRVLSTCSFKSLASAQRVYQVFVLVNLDLAGGVPNPGPDDRVEFDPSTFNALQTELSSSNFANIAAINPTKWQVGNGSTIASLLNGGSNNLNNANGPFSGDAGVAFQWTLDLAPGETRDLKVAYAFNQNAFPCPCAADFDNSGGTPDAGDIDAFFAAWLSGEAAADVDCSGGTPDAGDIDVFFAAWLAGGC